MILDSQYLFLMLHKIIGGTPVCYHLVLRGAIDIKKMEKSLNAVIQAHPALRLTFEIPTQASSFSQWRTKFLNDVHVPLRFQDLTGISSEDFLLQEYHRLLNKKNPLNHWPLFEVSLFKTDKNTYHLFMGIDHVIADGLSNLQILHQWLAHYAENRCPIASSVTDYIDTVLQINDYHPETPDVQRFQDLISKIKKGSYYWNPSGKTSSSLVPDSKTVVRTLSEEVTQKCRKIAEAHRISLYAIIVAAYLDLFFTYDKVAEKVIFTLPTSGALYPNVDASSYIGCFAQAITLAFSKDLLQLPQLQRLQQIHEEIHFALQIGFDHIQNQKLAASIRSDFQFVNGDLSYFTKMLFRASMKSNIYISYIGDAILKKHYGNLEVESYREGTFNNAGVCDFMHTLFNRQLHLFGNYDAAVFDTSLIVEMMDRLVDWFSTLDQDQKPFVAPNVSLPDPIVDSKILESLMNLFASTYGRPIYPDQIEHDLEGKLGLDSLGRVRFITRILKEHREIADRNALFKCRTLLELAKTVQANVRGSAP